MLTTVAVTAVISIAMTTMQSQKDPATAKAIVDLAAQWLPVILQLAMLHQLTQVAQLLRKIKEKLQECATRLLHLEDRSKVWYISEWLQITFPAAYKVISREGDIGSLLPPARFKQWLWRQEGCPMASHLEHQANQELPDQEITKLRLSSMASSGHEAWLRHNLPAGSNGRKTVPEQHLSNVKRLDEIHKRIANSPGAINDQQKQAWVQEVGCLPVILQLSMLHHYRCSQACPGTPSQRENAGTDAT